MARSIQRAGDYYGHKHSDLRLMTEYRDHLRETRKVESSQSRPAVRDLLKSPGITRNEY